jgi:hypothetical protein
MRNQFRRLLGVAWLLTSAFISSNAETTDIDPTLIWTNPDGKLADFDSTLVYQVGEVVMLTWDKWPYDNPINTTDVYVDMWLTGLETGYATRLSGILSYLREDLELY